jgi:hypothetical protein
MESTAPPLAPEQLGGVGAPTPPVLTPVPGHPDGPSPRRERGRTRQAGVLRRIVVGRARPSTHLEHTLLPRVLALPVFSSDALSSVAYATEEALLVLVMASISARTRRADRHRHRLPDGDGRGVIPADRAGLSDGCGLYVVSKDNLRDCPRD